MRKQNFCAGNADNNFLMRKACLNSKAQHMKESNILEGNKTIKQCQSQILLNINCQNMKDSNILVGNAAINLLQKDILLNKKGQCMKEPNTSTVSQHGDISQKCLFIKSAAMYHILSPFGHCWLYQSFSGKILTCLKTKEHLSSSKIDKMRTFFRNLSKFKKKIAKTWHKNLWNSFDS